MRRDPVLSAIVKGSVLLAIENPEFSETEGLYGIGDSHYEWICPKCGEEVEPRPGKFPAHNHPDRWGPLWFDAERSPLKLSNDGSKR